MKKLKVICIDSFKLDYLEHAPYLKSLTGNNQYGSLKVPIGFWGGMETFFKGKSDAISFYFHTKNSSFKWTRYISFIPRIFTDVLINLQRLIKNQRQFLLTHNIPLKKLHNFDTIVKRKFEQDIDFDYLHIGELDSTAHKYGTKADETKGCIKMIDKKLSEMDFDIIMSDHGMVDVEETITVPETDVCFIDSVIARYYGEKPSLNLKKGKIINADKRFGDTVYIANPGVLILPNYWQGNKPVKAMHGYENGCEGFFIIKKEGKRKDLKMEDLHKILNEFRKA